METCYVCGASGASHITLRGISSRIIWFNIHKINGPVCAGCAEGAYGVLQRRTLIQGWWGPLSFLCSAWNALANIASIRQHRSAIPIVYSGRNAFPRPHVHVRTSAGAWIATILAFSIVGFLALAYMTPTSTTPDPSSPSDSVRGTDVTVGSCWAQSTANSINEVSCADNSARFQVTFIVRDLLQCPGSYLSTTGGYACLEPL